MLGSIPSPRGPRNPDGRPGPRSSCQEGRRTPLRTHFSTEEPCAPAKAGNPQDSSHSEHSKLNLGYHSYSPG